MIFKLGRNENNNYVIDNPTVSNFHAEIHIEKDGSWTIHDMDSANGIYVNGTEVAAKKIQPDDEILLGKYKIENSDLKEKIGEFRRNNQLDFSQEFNVIKEFYDEYNGKVSKLKSNYKLKPMLIRGGITLTMMAIILILPIKIDVMLRSTLMVIVGIIGGMAATLMVNDAKLKNQLDILFVQYAKKICCPKCGHELINKSWLYWKERGGCPKCNCNWKD